MNIDSSNFYLLCELSEIFCLLWEETLAQKIVLNKVTDIKGMYL